MDRRDFLNATTTTALLGSTAALAATRGGGRLLLVGHQVAPRELDLFALTVREIDLLGTQAHVCQLDLPDAVAILAATDIAKMLGVSRATVYRYLSEAAPLVA